MRILIIQTAFVGDLLLGIPLFKQLRRLAPEVRLTVFCRKGLGEFLTKSGLIDEVIEADKNSSRSWKDACTKVLAQEFDLLLCPHESFRSALLAHRARAKRKIGYPRWFNQFIFTDRVVRPMELPEALRQFALLGPVEPMWNERLRSFASLQSRAGGQGAGLGELVTVPDWADMQVPQLMALREAFRSSGDLSLASSDRVRTLAAKAGFAHGRRIVFLAPGSVWRTKQWTLEGFTSVARARVTRGDLVVLTGAPQEKPLCDAIVKEVAGVISLAGETSLYESAELLACADLLVCNDSGAMHMAAAAGVPSVSVFGPTILDFGYRPWQNKARVAEVELDCRPCGKHGAKACPLGTHECMKRVSADDVLKLTDKF